MKQYKHIFFDLDHTLWDTDKNSEESLQEIYSEFDLCSHGLSCFEDFLKCYRSHNERLWGLYSENKIGRDIVRVNRFRYTLEDFNINNYDLANIISDEFAKRTPYKPHLLKDTVDILQYISLKYPVSIITNGFKESQGLKLQHSGIQPFFKAVYISEEIGFNKPDARIFEFALEKAAVKCHEAIMIGDTYETDIVGARSANIDQVYLKENPDTKHSATHIISALSELRSIL